MKLTLEDMKTIAQGVVSVEEKLGEFVFHRFTREQAEAYAKRSLDSFNKTFATAGVRLSFYTDAERMSFDYKLAPGSSRMFGWFDVYEDGVMTSHIGGEGRLFNSGHAEIGFTHGEKRVEIYLPWSKATYLSDVELEGRIISPCKRSRTMIMLGDSITQGYDAKYPSLTYASTVAHELDADAINKGIGGEVFFPELANIPDPVRPEIITVAYGTNDWNSSTREHFEKSCREFYENICKTYPTSKIFAITPVWRGDGDRETRFGAPHSELDSIMRELIADLPLQVVNGYTLLPRIREFYSDEYLHPGDTLFQIYARELLKFIKKHL